MQLNFGAQVDDWVRKVEGLEEAVFKTAAQSVMEEVKQRTPVDTGTLRNSFLPSINAPLPARPIKAAVGALPEVVMSFAGAKLGDTVYGSFIANYAVHVEFGANGRPGAGMVRLAAQNWPQHVASAVSKAAGAIGRQA